MKQQTGSKMTGLALRASSFLTIFVFLAIATLLTFAYRVTREWQQGVAVRVASQNEESADLIIKAITRDMRGAQARILANRDWDAPLPAGFAQDMTAQVATTFARYPYPESFFTWSGGHQSMLFFSRTDRPPGWSPAQPAANSPITLATDPAAVTDLVRRTVLAAAAAQRRYAVFNTTLAGVPYQVVARLTYSDSLRERLDSVSGFTVNLDWVRKWYFSDILAEVGPSASRGLTEDIALLDENNRSILGSDEKAGPMAERTFPLLFMDLSDTAADIPSELIRTQWKIRVRASRDPILVASQRRLDTTLLATALALVLCGASLLLSHRAVLSGAKVSEMRSRFVSSVTHELKTPLAGIHALAATLARQPQGTSERYREYPKLLIRETEHLGRLVDNLLAYSRITSVAETYTFEPMAAAELVEEALHKFEARLAEQGIEVHFEMPADPAPADLPFVSVDQRAMLLAVSNVIDNAIRHAHSGGHIFISIQRTGTEVSIEVRDDGCGISAEKLAALRESIASRAFAPSDGGGLGLAIVSSVVADHHGRFSVDSRLGNGTRCTIGLRAV